MPPVKGGRQEERRTWRKERKEEKGGSKIKDRAKKYRREVQEGIN